MQNIDLMKFLNNIKNSIMNVAEIKEVRLKYREFRKNKLKYADWIEFIEWKKEWTGEADFKEGFGIILENIALAAKRLKAYKESPLYRFRIRKYCNKHFYTDIEPWEVVEVISTKKVRIRQMDAVIKTAPKEFHQGGFSGNFSDNDQQRWECVSNPENETEVITLTKKGWGQGQYIMSDEPRKFYDYNF